MATDTTLVTVTRNLPTTLTGDVERLGYSMLRALDRLGFVHEAHDGGLFAVRFDAVRLYGSTWAAYHLDDAALLAVARRVSGVETSGPTLTDVERDLLTWAVEHGGALPLADIRARAGVGQKEARRLAESFERRGWLAKDTTAGNRRVLTSEGRLVAEKADKPNKQADKPLTKQQKSGRFYDRFITSEP